MKNTEIVKWLQSLKKEIGKQNNQHLWNYEEVLDMAIKTLQTKWIPVGERLPENPEQVFITVLWHKPYNNYEVTLGEYWHDSEGWGDWEDAEIVAWMPLPEPYREDREEYELATEQMEHDAMYEPTYNPEDGSM